MRVGVVGTGFAASAHAAALRRVPGARLVAVAGSSLEKAEQAAARFGADRGEADWRALVEADDVDVVHDCTPNVLHANVNHAALAVGKHVLSEKPLGMDAAETAGLVEDAAAAGVVAGVCFNYRHYPLVRELRGRIASGADGRPHLVRGEYVQDWLLHETDWNWRLETDRAGSSRAVADIGSHWLDLVQHVTGDDVVAVCAQLGRLHDERLRPAGGVETFARAEAGARERVPVDTEDFAGVLLRFAAGCQGTLTVSQVSAGRKNRLHVEIDTARACFAWDQEEPNRLWIGRRDGPNEELVRDPSLLSPPAAALAHLPGGHQEGWLDALTNLLLEFYEAVAAQREGRAVEPTFATFADAHRTMRLVDAIVESARTGHWVDA